MLKSECFEAHYHSRRWEIFPTDAYYDGMASFNICLPPQSEEDVQRTIDAMSLVYKLAWNSCLNTDDAREYEDV